MNKRSDPILRYRRVSLTGFVLGKEDIAGSENSFRAVADADLDCSGKSDAPLAPRRWMPAVKIITIHIVLENQCLYGKIREKILRSLALV
jgi:hypothetical protein